MAAADRTDVLEPTADALLHVSRMIRDHDVRIDGPDAGYTELIDVVGDIGRGMVHAEPSELHRLLPAIAAVREGLEEINHAYFGHVARTPSQALAEEKLASAYAAGALWACNSVLASFLEAARVRKRRTAGRASRADVREAILGLLARHEPIRPADVIEHFENQNVEVDGPVISHALSDLIEREEIRERPVPTSYPDRRARFYELATSRG